MTPTLPRELIRRAAGLGITLFAAANWREQRIRLGGAPFAAKRDERLIAVFDTSQEISEWLGSR